jgi:aminoglycoside phosphotransferase (APT) family kinase protein
MSADSSPAVESGNFDHLDRPSQEFIDRMTATYRTESETNDLLVRKLQRRRQPAFVRTTKEELVERLRIFLTDRGLDDFEIHDSKWFVGGASKIQLGFTLDSKTESGRQVRRMVLRMDPSESLNATSRVREFEMLRAFEHRLPVPRVYWIDAEGAFFPEPALVYEFVEGVTKPTDVENSGISGVGTNFGTRLRKNLADQFVEHLAVVHTFQPDLSTFARLDRPSIGTTESAQWQVNRALRVWDEDRGEDLPLMEVAANWLLQNLPVLDAVSVVHGDFRSGNFLFDDESGDIRAWLDWERSHLGDRHRDLAWTTQKLFGHYSGDEFLVCGLMPEPEFYSRYSDLSGMTVDRDRLHFYKVLNCFQLVVSTVGTAYRVTRLSKSHQDVLLARVRGEAPVLLDELRGLLRKVAS